VAVLRPKPPRTLAREAHPQGCQTFLVQHHPCVDLEKGMPQSSSKKDPSPQSGSSAAFFFFSDFSLNSDKKIIWENIWQYIG
jgi:hypothetical protein